MKNHLFLLAVAILLSSSVKCQNSWVQLSPFPAIQDLQATYFFDEQKGWVVGDGGLISFTNDGGVSWETQHQNGLIDQSFHAIDFCNENEGWVVGWGYILHTDDAGQNWEVQDRPIIWGDLTDVFFINQDTGWTVGRYKIILKTTDGGQNWIKISNSTASGENLFGVYFTDHLHGCAVGGMDMGFDEGFIMVTEDGGETWVDTSPENIDNLNDVYFMNQDTGFACGYDGNIIKTTDGGYTWQLKFEDYGFNISDIYFFNSLEGIAVSHSEYAITEDGGETWTMHYLGSNKYITGFAGINGSSGIGVGDDFLVLKASNMGNDWIQISDTIPQPYLNNIGFFDELNGIKTSYNTLMMTNDGGISWDVKELGIEVKIKDLCLPTPTVGYLLSNLDDKLIKTINGGQDWTVLDLPVLPSNTDYTQMQFIDELNGFIIGEEGYVYRTSDGGLSWQEKSISTQPNLTGMYFLNKNLGWLLDVNGKVLKTVSGGNSYSFYNLQVGNTVYKPLETFFVNEQIGFISTSQNVLFKTVDGGDNWFIVFELMAGSFKPKIFFLDENIGWLKGTYKILFTDDGGENWQKDVNFYSNYLTDMFFQDGGNGWVCGENNFVAKYGSIVFIDDEIDRNEAINVYPNPASDQIIVSAKSATEKILGYNITDIQGRLLMSSMDIQNQNEVKIDISLAKPGVYLLEVKLNQQTYVSKFIKN